MSDWLFNSGSEKQTLELGMQLGRLLKQPTLILLRGDLGAGKSVLARGIARGLGVAAQTPITSPTFTLMNHYPARLDLYHFDLYRLNDPDELIEIGFDDFAHGSGVALVEWPERLGDDATPGLWISLQHAGSEQRKITFQAKSSAAQELLDVLKIRLDR
ncbi:MAG TPA: tRNA (adenosine(37)-N6)-threonylcarbamoyltransferase complex ATPase subunit type 1 TsaE [Malonomonas sp.]